MKRVSRLLFAACLLASTSLALAAPTPQDHEDHDHGGHDEGHDRGHGDHGRGHGDERGHHDERHYGDGGDRWRHHDEEHHWERGHRYYGPSYVVRDYGYYRLRPPPRGYHWVRDDNNDLLLVAITTGIILDIASH